jgi:hypothetical protein
VFSLVSWFLCACLFSCLSLFFLLFSLVSWFFCAWLLSCLSLFFLLCFL